MEDDEDVDVAELVRRAHQWHLLVPGEVAEVEDLQRAEGDFSSEGVGVLGSSAGRTSETLQKGLGSPENGHPNPIDFLILISTNARPSFVATSKAHFPAPLR
jgi:hypothetical protein